MRDRRHASKASTFIVGAALAVWPALLARAGDLPTTAHETTASGAEARALAPSTPFHLTLRGRRDGDDADMLLDVMVFPATRQIAGMLRSRGPDEVVTHVSGKYESDGSSIEAHLTGFPPPISGCFGHGLPVSKMAEVDVAFDAEWKTAKAAMSYKVGDNLNPNGEWRTTAETFLGGGEPLPWRDVDDIRWGGDAPFAWKDGPCFTSDDHGRARLASLDSDASRRFLNLSDRPVRSFTPWTIRNDSVHHILAMVTCASRTHAVVLRNPDVVLLHPHETRSLRGFRTLDDVTCNVIKSHFDD